MATILYVRPSRWKKNLAIIVGLAIVAHAALPLDDVTAALGMAVGALVILWEELRYRSMLMDLMDIQLIEVSAKVDRLADLETETRKLRAFVDDLRLDAERR